MTIGEKIREIRELKGMTQLELAQKCGYRDRSTIAKIESGTNDIPRSKLLAIAKALDVTPGELLADATDAEFRRLKAYYDALNDNQRKTLVNYAEFLKGSDSNKDG
jgi:transcriptional regulator with XRE-family HTH domain